MRLVGIYGRNHDGFQRLWATFHSNVGLAASERLERLLFPPSNPIVATMFSRDAEPAITWTFRPDGSFALVDGEINNIAGLENGTPSVDSNSADAVLNLYLKNGIESVARVDATASLTIWDAAREQLLLVRDRAGSVPLFYWHSPDGLAWAWHIIPLLQAGSPRRLNLPAVDYFLGNGYVAAPWTMVETIHKIPAAHFLRSHGANSVEIKRYWQITGQPKLHLTKEKVTERLGELFEQALRRRLSSSGKRGLLLSSGIDSTLLAAMLRRKLDIPLESFTIGFADYEGAANELEPARRSANYLGTNHHEIILYPQDIPQNLAWMVRSFGEPLSWGLRGFKLGEVRKAGVRALFSGDGGDPWYLSRAEAHGILLAHLPRAFRRFLLSAVPMIGFFDRSLAAGVRTALWCADTGLPSRCGGRVLPSEVRLDLYKDDSSWREHCRQATEALFQAALNDYAGESRRDRVNFLRRSFNIPESELYFNHWWGRSHGLAMRLPFHDIELLQFVTKLERPSTTKDEIRRLAVQLVDPRIAFRPKTRVGVPIGYWFRGPLREFLLDELSSARMKSQGLFNVQGVQQIVQNHLRGKSNEGMRLWVILVLLAWQDLVLNSVEKISVPSTFADAP